VDFLDYAISDTHVFLPVAAFNSVFVPNIDADVFRSDFRFEGAGAFNSCYSSSDDSMFSFDLK